MSVEREAGRFDDELYTPLGVKCAVCKLYLNDYSVRLRINYGKGLEALQREVWLCAECVELVRSVAK